MAAKTPRLPGQTHANDDAPVDPFRCIPTYNGAGNWGLAKPKWQYRHQAFLFNAGTIATTNYWDSGIGGIVLCAWGRPDPTVVLPTNDLCRARWSDATRVGRITFTTAGGISNDLVLHVWSSPAQVATGAASSTTTPSTGYSNVTSDSNAIQPSSQIGSDFTDTAGTGAVDGYFEARFKAGLRHSCWYFGHANNGNHDIDASDTWSATAPSNYTGHVVPPSGIVHVAVTDSRGGSYELGTSYTNNTVYLNSGGNAAGWIHVWSAY